MKMFVRVFLLTVLFGIYGYETMGQTVQVITWNVDSKGITNDSVTARIREYQGIEIWGLINVSDDQTLKAVEEAVAYGENAVFKRVLGHTGSSNKLGVVYNSDRFSLIQSTELTAISSGNQIAPLLVEFLDKYSKQRFFFLVNHLEERNAALRQEQAAKLNFWVKQQTLPVIAAGDFNFDWDIESIGEKRDQGFDNLTANKVWNWIRPAQLVKTDCSKNNSIMNFFFVNKLAARWNGQSKVLKKEGDCQLYNKNSSENSAHRPVIAVFNLTTSEGIPVENKFPKREEILRRINQLENELKEIKSLLQTYK